VQKLKIKSIELTKYYLFMGIMISTAPGLMGKSRLSGLLALLFLNLARKRR
jgi:hypothetical protein